MSRRAVVCSIILMMVLPEMYAQQAKVKWLSNSRYTFVYRMDSAEAWAYLTSGNIDPHARCYSYKVDSFVTGKILRKGVLPAGHYLMVYTQNLQAHYSYVYEPGLQVQVAGINKELQVRVYDMAGNQLSNARVFTDKKEVKPDTTCHCFRFSSIDNRNERLRVYANGQFVTGRLGSDYQPPQPVYDFERYHDNSHTYSGYLISNKPRYFAKDTVRIKAYLLDNGGYALNATMQLQLREVSSGQLYPLGFLYPVSPGAYVHNFVLGDSLHIDRDYELRILDEAGFTAQSLRFKLEDYVLMKNKFEVRMRKNQFAAREKVELFLRASDANGLPVPDAKVKVRLRMSYFTENLEPYLEVPDSWNNIFWEHTYDMNKSYEEIILPDSIFPRAQMGFVAEVRFTDGNNELHSENISFSLNGSEEYFTLALSDSNTLDAGHIYKGKSKGGSAWLRAWHEGDLLGLFACTFPCHIIPQPMATRYDLLDSNQNLMASVDVKDQVHERVLFVADRKKDSVFVQMLNPDGLDVYVRYFSDDNEVGQGHGKNLQYRARVKGRRSFRLVYTYLQGGKTRVHEQSFHVYEKSLTIETDMPEEVLPGQSIPVQLRVLDYRGRPRKNVNIAAWAVNSSFTDNVVPELPYFGRSFEPLLQKNNAAFTRTTGGEGFVAINREMLTRSGLLHHDTLLSVLFPPQGCFILRDSINYRQPEFAPFVWQDGVKQQIYYVYVDSVPVYIHDVNRQCPYSFLCSSGRHNLRLRTGTCIYSIDSVLFTDSTRTIISIDALLRPQWVRCDSAEEPFELGLKEGDDLLKHTLFLWRDDKDPGYNKFLEQDGYSMYLSEFNGVLNYNYKRANYGFYGPFKPGFVKLYIDNKDSVEFLFNPDYAYKFSNGQMMRIPHPQKAFLFNFLKGNYARFEMQHLWQAAHRLPYYPAKAEEVHNNPATDTNTEEEQYPHNDVMFDGSEREEQSGQVEINFPYGSDVRNIWFINTRNAFNTKLDYHSSGVYNNNNLHYMLNPGTYRLLIVDRKGRVFEKETINVQPDVRIMLRPDTTAFTHSWEYIKPVLSFIEHLENNQGFLNAKHYRASHFVVRNPPFSLKHVTIIDHKTGIAGFVADDEGRVSQCIITAESEWRKTEGFSLSADDGFFDMVDLPTGTYTLRFASPGHKVLIIDRVMVKAGQRAYIKVRLLSDAGALQAAEVEVRYEAKEMVVQEGLSEVMGKVIDERDRKPLEFASVVIKLNNEMKGSTVTDEGGNYAFKYLKPGTYVIEVSYVGYQKVKVTDIRVPADRIAFVNVDLMQLKAGMNLEEVKVVARKTPIIDPTGKGGQTFDSEAIIRMPTRNVNNIANVVEGVISVNEGTPTFRGARAEGTAYYIDGVRVVGSFNMPQNAVQQVRVGMGYEATDKWATSLAEVKSKYTYATLSQISGLKEVNRVRSVFRDYAYWQPNHITDKKGMVHFTVQFPDNITGWQNIVLAMNDDFYSGSRITFTRSFKPLSAALALPRFMVEGDSACLVGRALNYINEPVDVQLSFCNGSDTLQKTKANISTYNLQNLPLVAGKEDTLHLAYALQTEKGYRDGEQQTLPVISGAIPVSHDTFCELKADTQFVVTVPAGCASTKLLFTNSKAQQLREQIEKLKQYRYGCTEQTSSKLKALLLEKNLERMLGDSFNSEDDIEACMQRLAKYQNPEGSWGWWSGNHGENWLTLYAMEALNMAERNGYHGESYLKGLTWLKNNLKTLNAVEQMKALLLLYENKVQLDYRDWVRQVEEGAVSSPDRNVDMLLILLRAKLGLKTNPAAIYSGMSEDDYGGVYWNASSSELAYRGSYSTLLAYQCLLATHADSELVQKVRRHFLHPRGLATCYRNTLETAGILELMLPDEISSSSQPLVSTLQLSGCKNGSSHKFPQAITLKPGDTLYVSKKGGMLDFGRWDYQLVKNPAEKTERFVVSTSFRQRGKTTDTLQQGEPAEMVIHVKANSTGEYLMLDVPVPAGCFYGNKTNNTGYWEVHREYFKNSTGIFFRELPRGEYTYTIQLDPRFTGRYALPAAQMQSMYDPDVAGNNSRRLVYVVK